MGGQEQINPNPTAFPSRQKIESAKNSGHYPPDWSATAEPVPYAKLDDPQSLNLYGYVGNNPLSDADPDGHQRGGWRSVGTSDFCRQQASFALKGEGAAFGLGAVAGLVVATDTEAPAVLAAKNLLGRAMIAAPAVSVMVGEVLENLTPGQSATYGRAVGLGVTSFEKIGEKGFVGALANGTEISAGFETGASGAFGATISNLRGSVNLFGLGAGLANLAKAEGASSLKITAASVENPELAAALMKRGYTAVTVAAGYGKTATDYVKTVKLQ